MLTKTKTYKLIGPNGKSYLSDAKGTLGGYCGTSRDRRYYGRLDCPSALNQIARGHYVKYRVFFADEATAVAAGYRPCAKCMPARYKEWKSRQQVMTS